MMHFLLSNFLRKLKNNQYYVDTHVCNSLPSKHDCNINISPICNRFRFSSVNLSEFSAGLALMFTTSMQIAAAFHNKTNFLSEWLGLNFHSLKLIRNCFFISVVGKDLLHNAKQVGAVRV